jgi:RNA polymerase sigma factor (sigma-70 family)
MPADPSRPIAAATPPPGAEGASAQESAPIPAGLGPCEALVRAWLPRVYGTALALAGRAAEAEDLTQDAFLRAFRERERLRDPAAFGPWVLRILRNAWTDRLRRGRRERALPDAEDVEARAEAPRPEAGEMFCGTPRPEAGERFCGGGGWEEATVAAWRRLPEDERLVCWLRIVVGTPFREIAVLLSTSKSAVDRTFRRALERLRGDVA